MNVNTFDLRKAEHLSFLLAVLTAENPPIDAVQSLKLVCKNVEEQYRKDGTVPKRGSVEFTIDDWITYMENELHFSGLSPLKYRFWSGNRINNDVEPKDEVARACTYMVPKQGVVNEPSMFQDVNCTIPATKEGDPVAVWVQNDPSLAPTFQASPLGEDFVLLPEHGKVTLEDFLKHKPLKGVGAKHSHYHKDVSKFDFVDVYRVLQLFNVTDPCLQHAIKKLLVAGGRGAGKNIARDIKEAIDSLIRWQEMRAEEVEDGRG